MRGCFAAAAFDDESAVMIATKARNKESIGKSLNVTHDPRYRNSLIPPSDGAPLTRHERKRATPCGAALPIHGRFKTSVKLARSTGSRIKSGMTRTTCRSLKLDGAAGLLDLLLDLLGFVLVDAFLDGLRSAFDERFGFAEAQAGDGADFLDDVDLLATVAGEDHVEFSLLFGSRASSGGGGGRSG